MLTRLVGFSLQYRWVVVTLAGVLLAYGVYEANHASLDVFPDFVPPQVTVQTESPGLAAEQVEALVTTPVESALGGLPGEESLRSESIQGLSIITLMFKEGTDLLRARQLVSERLAELAGTLPQGVRSSKMSPLMSATMDLLKIGMLSTNLGPRALRTFADWTLRPRLLAVAGVAKCSVFGGEVRQLQVQVRPAELVARGLSLGDVVNAARMATAVRGAGFIETANQRIILQTEGQVWTAAELGNAPLRTSTNGVTVRLRDVAEVIEGAEPSFGESLIMGEPGVLLTLASQYGANTMDVTREVEAALDEMQPVFARVGIRLFPRLHRPATFIETALGNMRHSLWLGAILVAVVLVVFLGNLRAAVISILAIPLSLLTAVVILDRLGITLNTITLGGLAIAIGEVVDDAIIDVENIVRRLRENTASPSPRPGFEVVLAASIEVRSAVVYATFVVALVFLPVLTLTGLQGAFFAPLAQSYLLAIGASLAVALTVTPAMTLLMFGRSGGASREARFPAWLRRTYQRGLGPLLARPGLVLALSLAACLGAAACLPFFGGDLLPPFREGHYVLQVSMAPGTGMVEMRRLGRHLAHALLGLPGIATVEQQIGRAEQGEDPWAPNRSEFHVDLKPASAREQDATADAIRAVLESFPGIQYEVLTFLGDRIGESISGETSAVVISVFGGDLDALDAVAARVAGVLETIPGHADVQVKAPAGLPRLVIRLRPDRLAEFGIHPVEALDAVETACQGTVVAQVHRGNEVSSLAVKIADAFRAEPEQIGGLLIDGAQGQRIPLREIADIRMESGRHSILHDAARRRQVVTCNVSGRDVGSFVAEARRAIVRQIRFPPGVYLSYGGAAEAARRARLQLLVHSGIAGIGILLLLGVVMRSAANLLLVLANVPFALVGGVVAVAIGAWTGHGTGGLSLGALVGFVTLFGITMRNSIMLLSHYEHLVLQDGRPWNVDTVIQGARERLVPILMTALVTGLGLLPLALGAGEAGREIEGPMAVVILGGLMTSTLLSLLVLPVFSLRLARFHERGEAPRTD